MYLSHFGLEQAPYGITPNPVFFYTGGKRGEILEALIYAVTHGEGIVKVTGEVGSGKTMLCRMLESRLPSNVEVIYLVNPSLGREEVLYAIAGEVGLATGGKRPDEVIRLLQEDLIRKHAAGKRVVLLIEEAQAMPLDTLEEVRLFSNLETAHNKLLQIVLFGQPELDESLKLPRMRQLKERITHSFKVPPMEATVIPDYLMHRLRAAGYRGPNLFSRDALRRIAEVSEGIVRRISILADKALLAAFAEGAYGIERKHVDAAVQDSEFSDTAPARARVRQRGVMAVAAVLVAAGAAFVFYQKQSDPTMSAPAVAASAATTKAAPGSAPSAPASEPASASAATATGLFVQRLGASHDWLTTAAPTRYTVQLSLMPAENRSQIERFLQKLKSELGNDQFYLYPTRHGGVARYGVTHGSFATRAEAVTALERLSNEWGYRPQLRTVQGLRQEIACTRSEDLWP